MQFLYGLIWFVLEKLGTLLFKRFKAAEVRKEHEERVAEKIEAAGKKHDEVVAKGEDATREERIKGVEDVLNAGD